MALSLKVMLKEQAANIQEIDRTNIVDIEQTALKMPDNFRIGSRGYDGSIIQNYQNQVEEYDIWLEDQIKAQNVDVMNALEDIFQKAQRGVCILTTICLPTPWFTHAHVVKRKIEDLAAEE